MKTLSARLVSPQRLVALLVMIALLSYAPLRTSLHDYIRVHCSYITYATTNLAHNCIKPFKQLSNRWKTNKTLFKANQYQQAHIHELQAQDTELEATITFQQATKNLASFTPHYKRTKSHLAHILQTTITQQEHSMLVNQGANAEIKKDMIVVYKNNLLGKITTVYPLYSHVLLVTDKRCTVSAQCAKTKALGIHRGIKSTQSTELCFVSHLQNVEHGDRVLTSGKGTIFPQGFCLGTIAHAQKGPLEYTISIQPLIDSTQLDYCFILAGNTTN